MSVVLGCLRTARRLFCQTLSGGSPSIGGKLATAPGLRHRVRYFMEQETCDGEAAVYARVKLEAVWLIKERSVVCAGVSGPWRSSDAAAHAAPSP